jgi:hypothetical protein
VRYRDEVYRAYWHLACERQRIFHRRTRGEPGPWTDDPILREYKFTNAYRASDRVSQFLIGDVIYGPQELPAQDVLSRIVLFRFFSRVETWQALEAQLGPITAATLDDPRLDTALEALRREGPIYTSAFILCAHDAFGLGRKHRNHVALVRSMLRAGLGRRVAAARGLADIFAALVEFPLIGPFMAYQLAIDINYSELTDFSEDDFTVAGPGAERGIRKVFPDATRRQMTAIIMRMVEEQHSAPDSLDLSFDDLFGRPLHAIDCQNLFCELDKYSRVAFPQLKSNRQRIKTRFAPSPDPLALRYPPKWALRGVPPN